MIDRTGSIGRARRMAGIGVLLLALGLSGCPVVDEAGHVFEAEPIPDAKKPPASPLNPALAPSENFDLRNWKLTLPSGDEVSPAQLNNRYTEDGVFYTDPETGGMVFRTPNRGGTTENSRYSRTELREMLAPDNNSAKADENNWTTAQGGTLEATLRVDRVSITGDDGKVGRVIIGQIHGPSTEVIRLYFHKKPDEARGRIYAGMDNTDNDNTYSADIVGNTDGRGIALGETFSYVIRLEGRALSVSIQPAGDTRYAFVKEIDADYEGLNLYFKAGVYNQNNTGDEADYAQATFFALRQSHGGENESDDGEDAADDSADDGADGEPSDGDETSDDTGGDTTGGDETSGGSDGDTSGGDETGGDGTGGGSDGTDGGDTSGGDETSDNTGSGDLNPNAPPSSNFDLSKWKITLPSGDEVQCPDLNQGYESAGEFYTDPETGGMVFRTPNHAGTTANSSYSRTELREMLACNNSAKSDENNWTMEQGGTLQATMRVDHVSTTGESGKVGRVVIGQIHGRSSEPIRLYYRKRPDEAKGRIYAGIDSASNNNSYSPDIVSNSNGGGIALGEVFSYTIRLKGTTLSVYIQPQSGEGQTYVTSIDPEYAGENLYFKAGAYNQNNTGDENDYVQVTFFALQHSHP